MNKKLTQREAIRICAELWSWIAKQKRVDISKKPEWPGWQKHGTMLYSCPCCEYNEQHKNKYCQNKCLLSGLWGGGCNSDSSPYNEFSKGINPTRNAHKIANYCKKLLKGEKK